MQKSYRPATASVSTANPLTLSCMNIHHYLHSYSCRYSMQFKLGIPVTTPVRLSGLYHYYRKGGGVTRCLKPFQFSEVYI